MALAAEFSGVDLFHRYAVCAPLHFKKSGMAFRAGKSPRVLFMREVHRKPVCRKRKVAYVMAGVAGLLEDNRFFVSLYLVALVAMHIEGHVLFMRELAFHYGRGLE